MRRPDDALLDRVTDGHTCWFSRGGRSEQEGARVKVGRLNRLIRFRLRARRTSGMGSNVVLPLLCPGHRRCNLLRHHQIRRGPRRDRGFIRFPYIIRFGLQNGRLECCAVWRNVARRGRRGARLHSRNERRRNRAHASYTILLTFCFTSALGRERQTRIARKSCNIPNYWTTAGVPIY